MTKTKYYCQCRLVRTVGESKTEQVCFIPEELAQLGSVLKVKSSGRWVDGWKVVFAGEKKDAKYVESNERTWTKTRKHSDI